jgi:hypothetical protein
VVVKKPFSSVFATTDYTIVPVFASFFAKSGIHENGGFYDICQYVEHHQQCSAIRTHMDRIVPAGALFCTAAISQGGHVV